MQFSVQRTQLLTAIIHCLHTIGATFYRPVLADRNLLCKAGDYKFEWDVDSGIYFVELLNFFSDPAR